MKDRNKLLIAIAAVLVITIIVVSGTYAFWQWTSNSSQQTSVTFTVPQATDLLYASLDGGGSSTVSNLAPAACTNSTYAMKKTVVLNAYNQTTQAANVYATLTLSGFTAPHGTPTTELSNIHYALTTSGTSCTTDVVTGTTGTFSSTSGALFTDAVIKTVAANTNTLTPTTYYLWVWIDPSYAGTNTGSEITDKLQDISFTLTWSGSINNTPA